MSPKNPYKIGHKCATGQEVAPILGQSIIVVIYTTTDNHLRWEYFANNETVPNWLLPSVTTFDSLMSKIKQVLPEQYRKDAYNELGKALFAALSITDETAYTDTFIHIKQDIILKATEPLRIRYILSATICSLFLASISIPLSILLKDFHKDAFVCFIVSLFGSLGSILSIMQRSTTLEIDPLSSKLYITIQGSIRAILGFLCGLFLLIVIKADLLLGLFVKNNYLIAVLAIVAGFSERLVPDLIKKFETMNMD